MRSQAPTKGIVAFYKEYKKKDKFFPRERLLRAVVQKIFAERKLPFARLAAIYINDKRMREIHGKFLVTKETTDVVTFSLGEEKKIEGEVYISLDTAERNAVDFKDSFEREVARLVIHGALHLTGKDDQTRDQKKIMKSFEEKYLRMYERLKKNT